MSINNNNNNRDATLDSYSFVKYKYHISIGYSYVECSAYVSTNVQYYRNERRKGGLYAIVLVRYSRPPLVRVEIVLPSGPLPAELLALIYI